MGDGEREGQEGLVREGNKREVIKWRDWHGGE